MPIYIFRVSGVVNEGRPLISWSGSFVSSVVRSFILKDVHVSGLSVSPLFVGGSAVLSGVNGSRFSVDVGSRVWLRFSVISRDFPGDVVDKLSNGVVGPFNVSEIDFEVVSEFPSTLAKEYLEYIDAGGRAMVEVFFYPTVFVFQGWRVLYPSPQRLIFGLAKSAVDVLNVDPRIAKRRARTLSRAVELVFNGTRVVKVEIGRGRVVKSFMGRAIYGVKGLENLRDFIDLLKLGHYINVGKSRGIGFGFYKFKILKVGRVEEAPPS